MDVSRRRAGVKTSIVAGSVWESRMKLDEVKGGIKVFNGETNHSEDTSTGDSPSSRKLVKRSPIGTGAKRKTWKSESFDGPIQIAKGKTNSSSSIKNCEEQCRELSVSLDGGINKSLMLSSRKGGRSYGSNKELSMSVDGTDKSSILGKKLRSEGGDGNERNPVQIRKARSDIKEVVESGAQLRKVKSDSVNGGNDKSASSNGINAADSGIEKNSVKELKKAKSETEKVLEESMTKDSSSSSDDSASGIEKKPPEIEENGSEESCKEFGVCQEKVISSNETNGALANSPQFLVDNQDDVVIDGDEELGDEEEEQQEEEELDDEMQIEVEVEKKSVDIMEISIPEEKPKMKVETKAKAPPTPQKQKPNNKKLEFSTPEQEPKKVIVNEENKRVYQFKNRAAPPTSSTVNKQPPPVLRRAEIYQNLSKPTSIPVVNECQSSPERHNKLQNIVDLVMWRDISRSAFVFGIGTFIIISSSYTKDLSVSFISVTSYLGLVYLALIFLYRTLICRGVIDIDDTRYVVGEEEAVWLLKLVLPYLNECLLKIRALFSGDPATTMKMAVLLFVFARCGTSITIWKMAKLGFFGVFTVPKVCSSYSTQLTAYGKFWIRRFRDAWDSCSHKKAVALAIFTLVWNLSSMVARVWAVFMMYVAVRYYQQSMELVDDEDWVVEDDDAGDDETLIGQKQGVTSGTTSVGVNKVKKWA
ncbi:reticulon-like protein B21 [Ricinus communis]|uniref:reticulon-like protein B21 n=1 Tax=Ricinus communis TaxID=3988 RepID=UPI00201A794C|nr:reticulon-like protein B21 [Ricinus communis]